MMIYKNLFVRYILIKVIRMIVLINVMKESIFVFIFLVLVVCILLGFFLFIKVIIWL